MQIAKNKSTIIQKKKKKKKKKLDPFGHYREISDLGLDVLTSLSLGQYIKASIWGFPVMTSLLVNKWYLTESEVFM